jgi:hypothetical protein
VHHNPVGVRTKSQDAPFDIKDVEKLLRDAGDLHSTVQKPTYSKVDKQWTVPFLNDPGHDRVCLARRAASSAPSMHSSNHCRVYVKRTDFAGVFSTKYVCLAPECNKSGKHINLADVMSKSAAPNIIIADGAPGSSSRYAGTRCPTRADT